MFSILYAVYKPQASIKLGTDGLKGLRWLTLGQYETSETVWLTTWFSSSAHICINQENRACIYYLKWNFNNCDAMIIVLLMIIVCWFTYLVSFSYQKWNSSCTYVIKLWMCIHVRKKLALNKKGVTDVFVKYLANWKLVCSKTDSNSIVYSRFFLSVHHQLCTYVSKSGTEPVKKTISQKISDIIRNLKHLISIFFWKLRKISQNYCFSASIIYFIPNSLS